MDTLRKILRSHFREGQATELYQQFTNGTQELKESAVHFLGRMMELRQKVLFASQEAGSGVQYDTTLVQNTMLRTLMTGLHNDFTRTEVTPSLKRTDISDEELLEVFNVASGQEEERQKKQQSSRKLPKVRSAKSSSEQKAEKPIPDETRSKPNAEMDALRAEMASIRELLKTTLTGTYRGNRRQPGCQGCKDIGQGENCWHCYKCGISGHLARNCQWGNDSGLPQGGQM